MSDESIDHNILVLQRWYSQVAIPPCGHFPPTVVTVGPNAAASPRDRHSATRETVPETPSGAPQVVPNHPTPCPQPLHRGDGVTAAEGAPGGPAAAGSSGVTVGAGLPRPHDDEGPPPANRRRAREGAGDPTRTRLSPGGP